MSQHEWSDWRPQPQDEPRSKEESKKVRIANGIACAILIPAMLGGWVWCGYQAAAQSQVSSVANIPASTPYADVMILASFILFPIAIAALLLRGRK